MKTISCKNIGMETCPWKGEGKTVEDLVEQVKSHHKKNHPDYWKDTMSSMSDEEIKEFIEPKVEEE